MQATQVEMLAIAKAILLKIVATQISDYSKLLSSVDNVGSIPTLGFITCNF